MSKRYYWLKLNRDFFDSVRIKKLRSIAGGDTFTIIYLKLLLHTIDTDGVIEYQGIENTISEELALVLNEDAENVGLCLNYLRSVGLAEIGKDSVYLPEAVDNVGSETASTQRSRECRARHKVLQCNTNATQLQHDCNVEKRREDIEKEIEKDKSIKYSSASDSANADACEPQIVDNAEVWFTQFWGEYPKKKDKANAFKAFKKVCKDEKTYETIMTALINQKKYWKDYQYIPYPSSWLNGKRWEDDVSQDTQKKYGNMSQAMQEFLNE